MSATRHVASRNRDGNATALRAHADRETVNGMKWLRGGQ
jgi:hypothetical protein